MRTRALVVACIASNVLFAQDWLDPSFGTDGVVATSLDPNYDGAFALERQPDGKLVIAGVRGQVASYDILIARYNTDGSLDTEFGTNGSIILDLGMSDQCLGMALGADGSIMAVGTTTGVPSGTDSWVARFTPDGTLDLGFNGTGYIRINDSLQEDKLSAVSVRPDGKVLVAGRGFTSSKQCFYILQYNSDGTLDTDFGTAGSVKHLIGIDNCEATCLEVMADGSFFCAGTSYTDVTSKNDLVVTKYSATGVLDVDFSSDGKAVIIPSNNQDKGYGLAVQPDGKILVGGVENEVNSAAKIIVARLLANGSIDTGFGTDGIARPFTGDFPSRCEDIAVADDGKILACGTSTLNAQGRNSFLCRLNSTGALDAAFGTGGILEYGQIGLYRETPGMVLQPDGKVVLAGLTGSAPNNNVLLLRYLSSPTTGITEQGALDFRLIAAAANELRIESEAAIGNIQVFDAAGKLITEASASGTSGIRTIALRSPLLPGAYVLRTKWSALRFAIGE